MTVIMIVIQAQDICRAFTPTYNLTNFYNNKNGPRRMGK